MNDEQSVILPGIRCSYPGCTEPAVGLAVGNRHWIDATEVPGSPLGFYCQQHAGQVARENRPEYVVSCPHCGCRFGVN